MGKIFFPEDDFVPFGVHAGLNGKSAWGGYGTNGKYDKHVYYYLRLNHNEGFI